jgi:hypothetical protein
MQFQCFAKLILTNVLEYKNLPVRFCGARSFDVRESHEKTVCRDPDEDGFPFTGPEK